MIDSWLNDKEQLLSIGCHKSKSYSVKQCCLYNESL